MKTLQQRLEDNIHWINEEDTIRQIIEETESWLKDFAETYKGTVGFAEAFVKVMLTKVNNQKT